MIKLLAGDCRDVLPTLAADSVHTVVTSPPYWNLRDYQTGTWSGGDAACDHEARANRADRPRNGLTGGLDTIEAATIYRDTCGKCGARRIDRQIGLEATPDEYLATMVAVFREIRRVMRPDAVAFVNMGDGYRDKQLLLMPARLALALQADGWWVRSDIIWHKPNPMPESCTDRPTSAHEHVFLLTKSARYWYDADAVREDAIADNREVFRGAGSYVNGNSRDNAAVLAASGKGHAAGSASIKFRSAVSRSPSVVDGVGTRSCRNVWTIATSPFSDWAETSRQVRVAWDAAVDGKKRKASPDCPVHGDRPVQAPNARDDGHAADPNGRTARTDADRAQEPIDDYAPIETRHGQQIVPSTLDLLGQPNLHAATVRSSQSHKTGHDPATSQPCSVSAGTGDGIARTSEAPEQAGSAGHTSESSSAVSGWDDIQGSETASHSARILRDKESSSASDPSSCTCEWYIEKTEKTSHFATFPPELAERCIRAGTSERGCCAACGKPWGRIVEKPKPPRDVYTQRHAPTDEMIYSGTRVDGVMVGSGQKLQDWLNANPAVTTGWQPACDHGADVVPCRVLDPFAGAGTTLLVADRLQRDAIGIELNVQYTRMAMDRCIADAPLFTSFPPAEPPEDERMRDLFADAAE